MTLDIGIFWTIVLDYAWLFWDIPIVSYFLMLRTIMGCLWLSPAILNYFGLFWAFLALDFADFYGKIHFS